jgi:hypothetical protein
MQRRTALCNAELIVRGGVSLDPGQSSSPEPEAVGRPVRAPHGQALGEPVERHRALLFQALALGVVPEERFPAITSVHDELNRIRGTRLFACAPSPAGSRRRPRLAMSGTDCFLGAELKGATLMVNGKNAGQGQLGVLLLLPFGEELPAGSHELLRLRSASPGRCASKAIFRCRPRVGRDGRWSSSLQQTWERGHQRDGYRVGPHPVVASGRRALLPCDGAIGTLRGGHAGVMQGQSFLILVRARSGMPLMPRNGGPVGVTGTRSDEGGDRPHGPREVGSGNSDLDRPVSSG